MEWHNRIVNGAKNFDIRLNRQHTSQFAIHARELLLWNRKMNLTGITDPEDVATKHFIDSIAPTAMIDSRSRILDIGSGGGFPGIPLKILNPTISVALIDASRKKVSFLKHVIRKLKLKNICAQHVRAEDLVCKSTFAHKFDIVISRALADLDTLVDLALPLLASGGTMVALKGKYRQNKIDDLYHTVKKDGLALDIKRYILPYVKSERTLIMIGDTDAGNSKGVGD